MQTMPVDWNVIIAVATAAATLGTFLGVWFAHRQHRKNEIEQRVTKAVDAKIGGFFMDLRKLEEEIDAKISQTMDRADSAQKQITSDLATREDMLREIVERASESAAQIEQLLQKSELVLPVINDLQANPHQLYFSAMRAEDPNVAAGMLARLLDIVETDVRVLEVAGDLARERFGNRQLAQRLYEKAVSIDPHYLGARSELLRLRAGVASMRPAATEEILQLARDHPHARTLVNNAFNVLLDHDLYERVLTFAQELLETSRLTTTLWRNIAVARFNLGEPDDAIAEAYEKAISVARDGDVVADEGGFVNTCRPYAKFLITRGKLHRAEEIITEALRIQPSEAQLHILRGELMLAQGRASRAMQSLEFAHRLGDTGEQEAAARKLRDIQILLHLGLLEDDGSANAPLGVPKDLHVSSATPPAATMPGDGSVA